MQFARRPVQRLQHKRTASVNVRGIRRKIDNLSRALGCYQATGDSVCIRTNRLGALPFFNELRRRIVH